MLYSQLGSTEPLRNYLNVRDYREMPDVYDTWKTTHNLGYNCYFDSRTNHSTQRLFQLYAASLGYEICIRETAYHRALDLEQIFSTTNRVLQYATDPLPMQKRLRIAIINRSHDLTDFFTALPEAAKAQNLRELYLESTYLKLSQRHRIRVYMKDDTILIFTGNREYITTDVDCAAFRKLLSCIPLFMGLPATDPFTEFCKAQVNEDAAELCLKVYTEMFERIPSFKDLKITRVVQFFDSYANEVIYTLKNEEESYKRDLDQLLLNYNDCYDRLNQARAQAHYLEQDKTLIDKNTVKALFDKQTIINWEVITTNRCAVTFRTPCTNYDRDAARVYYRGQSDSPWKRFFKAIFIDEKIHLLFTTNVKISFAAQSVDAQGRTGYGPYLPNPHHEEFNCWGNYRPAIASCFKNRQYTELLYQISVSLSSLNMTDYTVLGQLKRRFEQDVMLDNLSVFIWEDDLENTHTYTETYDKYFKEDANNETN